MKAYFGGGGRGDSEIADRIRKLFGHEVVGRCDDAAAAVPDGRNFRGFNHVNRRWIGSMSKQVDQLDDHHLMAVPIDASVVAVEIRERPSHSVGNGQPALQHSHRAIVGPPAVSVVVANQEVWIV
jgi:hypothetical protein